MFCFYTDKLKLPNAITVTSVTEDQNMIPTPSATPPPSPPLQQDLQAQAVTPVPSPPPHVSEVVMAVPPTSFFAEQEVVSNAPLTELQPDDIVDAHLTNPEPM